MTVRVIIAGAGARSRVWQRVLAQDPRCTLVGLVDTDPRALAEASAAVPGVIAGSTVSDVAAAVRADAVILATPPGGRHAQIAQACAAGLAILAEKPLADSLHDAAAHVAVAQAAGVALMVGLNFRYLPVTLALRDLFAPDCMGAPAFARFTYERWRDGTLPHLNRYPLNMPQPMLWEQSIHHFDLMRHVYGTEPVAIAARTFNPPWSMYADDANVSALITFANGMELAYHGTWAGNWQRPGFHWRTECANGIAVQADMFGALGYARRDDPELTEVTLPPHEVWVDDAAALLRDFCAHLLDGAPLACSGVDHLKSLRMVEACIRASQTGTTINPADLPSAAEPASRAPDVHTERRKFS